MNARSILFIAALILIYHHIFNQEVPTALSFHTKLQKPIFQSEKSNTMKPHPALHSIDYLETCSRLNKKNSFAFLLSLSIAGYNTLTIYPILSVLFVHELSYISHLSQVIQLRQEDNNRRKMQEKEHLQVIMLTAKGTIHVGLFYLLP